MIKFILLIVLSLGACCKFISEKDMSCPPGQQVFETHSGKFFCAVPASPKEKE
jgi:hypothetical protein